MEPLLTHATFYPWLWLIPVLPLVGAAVNGLFGAALMRRFGPAVNHVIAIALPTGSFVIAVHAVMTLGQLDEHARVLAQNLYPFIHIGFLDADMAFWLDPLSATMTLIITFIGTLIHVYSVGYMRGDPSYWRFFAYLNLFMASMLMLVLGDNFLVMFIGWEGVGLCSYLLISFWYKEKANAVAGMKAFIVNRVGDFGFVLGVALLFWGLAGSYHRTAEAKDGYLPGFFESQPVPAAERAELSQQATEGFEPSHVVPPLSLRFDAVRARVTQDKGSWTEGAWGQKTFLGVPLILLVCLLLFVGATGKSAQIPLYTWLPDAMAGPTPVSALIHAATMVTAGVYMVARLNFLFALSPTAMTVVALVGAVTALYAATIGLFQYDIKKVLAYSTVSQLGFMFIGVGVGAYWAGIYHLLNHAVFKALLFLGSGSVILGCHHEQDMRKMGGLGKYMPTTRWTYGAGALAITTAPIFLFSNGFFSKDEILWKAFDAGHLLVPGWVVWLIGFVGAGFTSFYMWRSYYMTFTGEYRGGHAEGHGHGEHHGHSATPHESERSITWVLTTLAVLILLTIPLGFWPLLGSLTGAEGLSEPWFEHWLHPVLGASTASLAWLSASAEMHAVEMTLALASIALALAMWGTARWLYKDAKNPIPARLVSSTNRLVRWPHKLIYNKYYIDELYDFLVVRRTRQLAQLCSLFDQKVIDATVDFMGAVGRVVATIDGAIDALVVDGAVNGVAQGTAAIGRRLRRAQTGRIQTYLVGAIMGALCLVAINYILFALW